MAVGATVSSVMSDKLKVLEFFSGIGGCAASLAGTDAQVVAAIDINRQCGDIYAANFTHPFKSRTIESLTTHELTTWEADLWWMSPPCQPFTRRGRQRDMDDSRSEALLALIARIGHLRPTHVALENVPGFQGSRAHTHMLATLANAGYVVRERTLCPTELGIPNRRDRFYLVASLAGLKPWPDHHLNPPRRFPLKSFLDDNLHVDLSLVPEQVADYRGALHVVDIEDRLAVASCFTSAYGRSMTRSGSYLKQGRCYRRFSPGEIARLLGFPNSYRLPAQSARRLWPLVGNSLSVSAVRFILSAIPGLHESLSCTASVEVGD